MLRCKSKDDFGKPFTPSATPLGYADVDHGGPNHGQVCLHGFRFINDGVCVSLVQLSTRWSDDLAFLFSPALTSYETVRI